MTNDISFCGSSRQRHQMFQNNRINFVTTETGTCSCLHCKNLLIRSYDNLLMICASFVHAPNRSPVYFLLYIKNKWQPHNIHTSSLLGLRNCISSDYSELIKNSQINIYVTIHFCDAFIVAFIFLSTIKYITKNKKVLKNTFQILPKFPFMSALKT